jgi:hypothetical protein
VDSFSQGLDDGETEGLAVLSRNDLEDCKFCCGDTNAQEAIGMLGSQRASYFSEGDS